MIRSCLSHSVLLRLLARSYSVIILQFLFSSRRRHTRSLCDWSSDVCSSDLAGSVLLLGLIGFIVYLFFNTPLLINPNAVIEGLNTGTIEQSTLETMALVLPVLMICICFLLFVLIFMKIGRASCRERLWSWFGAWCFHMTKSRRIRWGG